MANLNYIPKYQFQAICERRNSNKKGVMLRYITKKGTPSKNASFHEFYGLEKTAQDVINRLEELNPGRKFIEA